MEWYYVRDGASQGPVSREELERMAQNGELRPSDLVWNQSMGEEWVPADSVPGLFGLREQKVATLHDPQMLGPIKLVDPARAAWHRMVLILFRPFELAKWFGMGFSAWLASMGENGGSFNPGTGGTSMDGSHKNMSVEGMITSANEAWAPVREFMQQYGTIVIVGMVVVLVFAVALALVFLWLQSRGRFMLLDNVLNNSGEIAGPWHAWRQHANSLFRWSLGYAVICLLILAALLGLSWMLVVGPCVEARAFVPSAWSGIAILFVLFLFFTIVTFYIGRFLIDFVVPLMYRHDLTTTEAWRKFLGLYHAHIGKFICYGLYYMVLQFLAGLAIMAAVVVTCFIAGCLMGIPYIGAVVLLPVSVFFRLYGVYYLAQYGGEFVVEARGE